MNIKTKINIITLSISLGFAANAQAAASQTTGVAPIQTVQTAEQQSESEKANALFERIFMENVMASPVYQTYLGIKDDYGKWDDIGDKFDDIRLARTKQHLQLVKKIDANKLDRQTKLSLNLLTQSLEQDIEDDQWRHHNYPVNQMFGDHSMLPSLLINQHQISNIADAKAYISRLNGIPKRLKQLEGALQVRAKKGIIAPKFVFPYVISDSKNIISGAPFDKGEDNALWADFNRKIATLKLDEKQQQQLQSEAKTALLTQVKPAYTNLVNYLVKLEAKADNLDGAWKLPQGSQFYNTALARTTTTAMTANDIHELGLSEVARIQDEMRAIKKSVGFEGDLQDFFTFMRDDEQFYYEDNEQGREAYLTEATALIDTMSSRLDEMFKVKPKAGMIVKRVEAFREKSAGKAFYNQPSPDGSRPGIYYANLFDMKAMPKYQMEALAYHEGNPGHHMQIAIAQELEGIPKFRKFGRYTAYTEGWGLYSEYFPKEMGMYSDPYSDFGRLAMELWRACRLVVDTGIHEKKWTREEGIKYYTDNTPNAQSDAIKMVERHIVMPSQATAYKVGMNKLLDLRQQAQAALGEKFDIREFHTLVLQNGPVPLHVLENEVKHWIKSSS